MSEENEYDVKIVQGMDGTDGQVVKVTGPKTAIALLLNRFSPARHVPIASTATRPFKVSAVPSPIGIENDPAKDSASFFAGFTSAIEFVLKENGFRPLVYALLWRNEFGNPDMDAAAKIGRADARLFFPTEEAALRIEEVVYDLAADDHGMCAGLVRVSAAHVSDRDRRHEHDGEALAPALHALHWRSHARTMVPKQAERCARRLARRR